MPWKLIERPRTVRISRQLARQFVDMIAIPNDRGLKKERMALYRKLLANGGFRPVLWATCLCAETGIKYRVNGKHTSLLFSSLDEIPELYATIEDYTADTLEEMAELYSTFDSRQASRNTGDINASFAGACPELRDLPMSIVNLCASAIAYHLEGDLHYRQTPEERARALLGNVDFVVWMADIMAGGRSQSDAFAKLKRVPVAAVMLATRNKNKQDATQFWVGVRDETGLSPDDPDRLLARWLDRTGMEESHGDKKKKGHAGPAREFYVLCIRAWNAWRKGKRDQLTYRPSAEIPKIL